MLNADALTLQAETALQQAMEDRTRSIAGGGRSREAVARAAREFEAMVATQMLKPMFEGIETDGIFGGGSAERMFRSLMLEQYGQEIAASGRLGIADAVQNALLDLQEVDQ